MLINFWKLDESCVVWQVNVYFKVKINIEIM